MKILPVIDLLNGVVVRGVAGRRSEYRPIESRLTPRTDPLSIARAFRDQFGLARLYVADLDGILLGRPNLEVYRSLAGEGFDLLIDAGVRDPDAAMAVVETGAAKVIAGLETWPGPGELATLCRQLGASRVVFSLDLKQGAPLGDMRVWGSPAPFEIAGKVVDSGVTELIVLDLSQVGVAEGVTTGVLCQKLLRKYPRLSVISGGGVRNADDLCQLRQIGLKGVLIASALHDGLIGARDIAAATKGQP